MTNIWEIEKDRYFITTNSHHRKTQGRAANNNYVYDDKTKIFREAHFVLDGNDNEVIGDTGYFGDYCFFTTFAFKDGVAISTPLYLVNHRQEKIAYRLTSFHKSTFKYESIEYDTNGLLITEYALGNVNEIKAHYCKFVSPKDVMLKFMLHLDENLDDDLL